MQPQWRQTRRRWHPGCPSPSAAVKQNPRVALRVRELGYPELAWTVAGVNGGPSRERADRPQVLATRLVEGASWGTVVLAQRKGRPKAAFEILAPHAKLEPTVLWLTDRFRRR